MAETIASICGQKHQDWNGILVANPGADLPPLGDKFSVTYVDLPPQVMPPPHTPEWYSMLRSDKGQRLLAGLLALRPQHHVMFVDYDDLVSNRLAGLAAENPTAPGWFFDTGYLYSGENELCLYSEDFHKFCGTSHIIRADLLQIPPSRELAHPNWIARWLGSHYFIKDDFDRLGPKLARLPFNGAIYRIGHTDAGSKSLPVRDYVRTTGNKAAQTFLPLSPELIAEFFANTVH